MIITRYFPAGPITAFALSACVAVAMGGCGDSPDDEEEGVPQVDCAAVTPPAFSEVSIWPKCTGCHASTVSGTDRKGAPVGVDFDTYEVAKVHIDEAMVQVARGSMPLGQTATDDEKLSLYAWGQCGTPP